MDSHMGKSGYLDLKFQSKGKGLAKKGWRRRWVTMHPLTDHCECRTVIRLQVYLDAASSKNRRQARNNAQTIYLDNVTDVRRIATSRSHAYAFQVTEYDETEEPVLQLAGENETVTQNWMSFLRAAFWTHSTIVSNSLPPLGPGMFVVTIVDNEHSKRLSLFGDYLLHVTPASFLLAGAPDGTTKYEWRLRSLMRFAIIESECDADINKLFLIIAGPSALNGAGSFKFFTPDAGKVLHCIHETINEAIAIRKEKEDSAETPVKSEACSIPTAAVTPRRKQRPGSVVSEPSRTPPKASPMARHFSLPVPNELISYEEQIRSESYSPGAVSEDKKDDMSFQSESSSSSNSRFLQCDSQSMRSGSPSPKSTRQHWRNYFPAAVQAAAADSDKSNRTTSVSSTGSRDSGVMLDSVNDFSSRTRVWVEESSEQSVVVRLSDITESDSRRSSQSDMQQGSDDVFPTEAVAVNRESDVARSQSFNHTKPQGIDFPDQRRCTVSTDSSLTRNKRLKKISDVYIDLDSILAAKAELDLKLGNTPCKVNAREVSVPPPLPPFPPPMRPLRRKPVPIMSDDQSGQDNRVDQDSIGALHGRLSRTRKSSRSRKLSSTSNVYFEVGSLSDIKKACDEEHRENNPETNSDNETMEKRDRKVSNLYLDLDAVALLRSESLQNDPCKKNTLTPPELPPREPSPRQREKMQHESTSREQGDRYRKNLAQFLGSPSYPVRDNPPDLPERPTTMHPPKKNSEPSSTVFSSILGTLTRRKKRINSDRSQSTTNLNIVKGQSQKVQSVTEWPLPPTIDSNVADNELYSPSSDEEFDVIDQDVFEDPSNSRPAPFPQLMAPLNKVWYENCKNTNSISDDAESVKSGKSPDSNNSFSYGPEVEESFYMSMSGAVTTTGTSPSSSTGDTLAVDSTGGCVDNTIQYENPYLVMSDVDGKEKSTLTSQSDLYMNIEQLCDTSEA